MAILKRGWKPVKENITKKRAKLSGKATDILKARTLASAHKRLAEILIEGMTVLDVGCGTGAITYGIAELAVEGTKR